MIVALLITVALFALVVRFAIPWMERELGFLINRSWFWVTAVVVTLLVGPFVGLIAGLLAGFGATYIYMNRS